MNGTGESCMTASRTPPRIPHAIAMTVSSRVRSSPASTSGERKYSHTTFHFMFGLDTRMFRMPRNTIARAMPASHQPMCSGGRTRRLVSTTVRLSGEMSVLCMWSLVDDGVELRLGDGYLGPAPLLGDRLVLAVRDERRHGRAPPLRVRRSLGEADRLRQLRELVRLHHQLARLVGRVHDLGVGAHEDVPPSVGGGEDRRAAVGVEVRLRDGP